MAVIVGADASYTHPQNGMTEADIEATQVVANRLNEVIIFRSTGPWAKRWLERGYPSKNFHVKGKSSDWGPHAGLVPYDGIYSKVGYDPAKAAKGTHANDDGLASGFAASGVLRLSPALLHDQLTRGEGEKRVSPVQARMEVPNTQDLLLTARRSGDGKQIFFRAFKRNTEYEIHVYPPTLGYTNAFAVRDRDPGGAQCIPLLVMTSSESGARNLPMTGDYDLMSVCPSWAQYGSRAATDIVKPGIALQNGTLQKGMAFRAGMGMDNVMDARLHTAGTRAWHDYAARKKQYQAAMGKGHAMSPDSIKLITQADNWNEHGDMGNLTPRILRCINELNAQMGATGDVAAMRRVHHNAESHRAGRFGGITEKDMTTKKDGENYGDGFPLTVFQPTALITSATPATRYGAVCTIETLAEFRQYAADLKAAGFFVPKSMLWGAF